MIRLTVLVKAVLALLFAHGLIHANTWYVHLDSTLNSIQVALDSCANYDTVLVAPGIYCENIVWPNTHAIYLISEYGPDTTIIDGDSVGSVISIAWYSPSASTSVIRGFTIQNGYTSSGSGGAIIFSGGLDWYNLSIIDNIIRNNSGGISCGGMSYCLISGNTITENSTQCGGGIKVYGYLSNADISNNTITHNTASEFGGGIWVHWYSIANISHNTISYNSAGNDGGGISITESIASITHNTISYNSVSNRGGAISCGGASGGIGFNTISNNTASYGGGISCYHCYSSLGIIGNALNNNTGYFGAGIWCEYSYPPIDSCTITHNNGDGVTCLNNPYPFEIYSCDIANNSGYGIRNLCVTWINAENNWWGHETGPYHAVLNPGGLGDSVSNYVGFDPWLTTPVGIEGPPIVKQIEEHNNLTATIFRGPLKLPDEKQCKILDIMGRVVQPEIITPGIYFLEINGVVTQKVVKVK